VKNTETKNTETVFNPIGKKVSRISLHQPTTIKGQTKGSVDESLAEMTTTSAGVLLKTIGFNSKPVMRIIPYNNVYEFDLAE
jgi:hypothetical protein